MAEQAKVTSIDALETLRSQMILFMTAAHRSVDEVNDDVRRTRMWLQSEQRPHWEREIRKRTKLLGDAKAELLTARMSGLRQNSQVQEDVVRKAKRALDEAEEKLRAVKTWMRNYDHAVDPLVKRLEGLRFFLDYDMPKGLAFLVQAQRTLEAYASIGTPASTSAPAASAATESSGSSPEKPLPAPLFLPSFVIRRFPPPTHEHPSKRRQSRPGAEKPETGMAASRNRLARCEAARVRGNLHRAAAQPHRPGCGGDRGSGCRAAESEVGL